MQILSLAAIGLFASSAALGQFFEPPPAHAFWRGQIAESPVVQQSPLSPLPEVRGTARHLKLAAPHQPIPAEAVIPPQEGGGTITLLVPWNRGWLVGTDNGEWGGSLHLTLANGRTKLVNENVIGGFTWHGSFYVMCGVSHLTTNIGQLFEIDLVKQRIVRRIDLPARPEEIVITAKQGLVLRTDRGDAILSPVGKIMLQRDLKPLDGR